MRKFRNDEQYFQKLLSDIAGITEILPPTLRRRKRTDDIPEADSSTSFKRLFYEILDLIINQIELRFSNLSLLKFFHLLTVSKFDSFHRKFPHELLDSLMGSYPNFFNKEKLQRELEVFYSDPSIFGTSSQLGDITAFIYKNELIDDVPEIYKFLCLVLSIPATSASVERSFSALKRIKSFTRNTMGQSRLNNLSILAIERSLVKDLSQTEIFYENMIDNFALSKNRRIDLIYKTE